MKKIPTIFFRNKENMKYVLDEINPECQWVFDGQGVAKRKYDGTCCGDRPWLGPQAQEPNCQESVQVVQRGASNVYFPYVVSSILIPPYSETLHRILDNQSIWNEICDVLDNIRVNGEPVISANMFASKAKKYGIEAEVFAAAITEKYLNPEAWSGTAEQTESAYRYTERQAFLGPRPAPTERDEFDIKKTKISDYSYVVRDYFSEVVLIPRLRETRALVGFSRVTPYDGDLSRLAALSKKELSWLLWDLKLIQKAAISRILFMHKDIYGGIKSIC